MQLPRWFCLRVEHRKVACRGVLASGLLLCSGQAGAQADVATAETLFEQGRDLLRAGNAAAACPKLAESQRLDPAAGTLLALAMCHEADGKLATAWAEFKDVAAQSRESRPDRAAIARDRAEAVRPRLSTLTIQVPSAVATVAGVELQRGKMQLGAEAWNTALPVDGGEYEIVVVAPGKETWRSVVTVRSESDAVVLEVPPLEDAAAPSVLVQVSVAPAQTVSAANATEKNPAVAPARVAWGPLRWVGIATAGAGAVALGVGGYFLGSALGGKAASNADCDGNTCGDEGFADRAAAIEQGDVATVFGIAGGVLLAAGGTLIVLDATATPPQQTARGILPGTCTHATFGINAGTYRGDAHVSMQFSGRFW